MTDIPTRPDGVPTDEVVVTMSSRDAQFVIAHLRFLADLRPARTADHAAANLTARWVADQIEAGLAPTGRDQERAADGGPDVAAVAADLVLTDALTPNDPETRCPDHYLVNAADVTHLVRTVFALASQATSPATDPATVS